MKAKKMNYVKLIVAILMSFIGGCCFGNGSKVCAATQGQSVANYALSQVGTKERSAGSDDVIYNDWYYGKSVKNTYSGQYAWCHAFVSYCANKSGISTSVIPKTASCQSGVNFFKGKNRYHTRTSGYTPVVGDIIYLSTDGSSTAHHVGIVYSVDGTYVYYVDGNNTTTTPHSVVKSKKARNNSSILGYGNPAYAEDKPPIISDVKVTELSKSGYTVSCTVKDGGSGVNRVQFPTWTKTNAQDDIIDKWETASSASGKKNGNTYTYKVKRSMHGDEFDIYITHIYAYSDGGSSSKAVVPNVNLNYPNGVTINKHSVNGTKVTIFWDKAKESDIQAYRIDRRIAGNDTQYETIDTLPASATSYTDQTLTMGAHYFYRCFAINSVGAGPKQSGYGVYTALDTPVIQKTYTSDKKKITVSWGKIKGADKYIIYRRKSGTDNYSEIARVTCTSYTDSNLQSSSGYWYKIAACNDGTVSGKSSDGGYAVTYADAPKVNIELKNNVQIKWDAVVGRTSHIYELYRKADDEQNYQRIASVSDTSYKDTGLKYNTGYTYKIIIKEKSSGVQVSTSDVTHISIAACTHEFGAWEVEKAATCTLQGIKSHTCKNCGYKVTEKIACVDHNYILVNNKKTTVEEEGYEEFRCSVCGDTYRKALGKLIKTDDSSITPNMHNEAETDNLSITPDVHNEAETDNLSITPDMYNEVETDDLLIDPDMYVETETYDPTTINDIPEVVSDTDVITENNSSEVGFEDDALVIVDTDIDMENNMDETIEEEQEPISYSADAKNTQENVIGVKTHIKCNIENKDSYSIKKKVDIKSSSVLRQVKLNGHKIKVKKKATRFSFKLKKYKKYLQKNGKWNKLVVVDKSNEKMVVCFKVLSK